MFFSLDSSLDHCQLSDPLATTVHERSIQSVSALPSRIRMVLNMRVISTGMPKATTKGRNQYEPSPKERGKARAGPARSADEAATSDPSQWRASKLRGSDTVGEDLCSGRTARSMLCVDLKDQCDKGIPSSGP